MGRSPALAHASVTREDLMGQRIALDHQPGAAAAAMLPVFAVPPLGLSRR